MFLISTILILDILISGWKGRFDDYASIPVIIFGYGCSAYLLRRFYKKEVQQPSSEEVQKIKRRLIRVSLTTWIVSIILLEIIMYTQNYPSIGLILLPVLSSIVIGPLLFFVLRSRMKFR